MTIKEFDKQEWGVDMKAEYSGQTYDVLGVDFLERLVALGCDEPIILTWVRCENIKLQCKKDPSAKLEAST